MIPITIDPVLRGSVLLGVFQAEGVTARGESPELEHDLTELTAGLRERFREPAQAVDLFQAARVLYRALGLDPTKTRPSSEALIRRVITGRGLYRINRVVDTCNLCSMDLALSIGLYDTSAVRWPATMRAGREGEGYVGLGKDHVNVAGRYTLVDAEGPFGNPSSDSFRTRIREETTDCTFVIFAPASLARDQLTMHVADCAQRMMRYCGGRVITQALIGS
jgi:DNA/RNA-binding domain of Phe-tRNA-synthetase-like protein